MTYKGLPLIYMDILNDLEGIEIISLVDEPAVKKNFIAFSSQEIKFSVSEEKRIVTGVALIPGQKIYRRDEDGTEYYISFTKEAIQRIAIKFFADHNSTNVNLEHQFNVNGCVYFESYLTNKERGINPKEFGDLPDGTWIVSCKITNDDVWKLIKDGTLRGFSVEGFLSNANERNTLDSLEELLDYLNNN